MVFPCELINATENSPRPGIGHTALVLGNNIVLYGGRNFFLQQFNPHVYVFDTVERKWRILVETFGIANRTGHCAFSCNSGIVFIGGATPSEISASVIHLNLFGTSHDQSSGFEEKLLPRTLSSEDNRAAQQASSSGVFEGGGLLALVRDTLLGFRLQDDVENGGAGADDGDSHVHSVSFGEI